MKLQKCTEPKHSWQHLGNITKTVMRSTGSGSITLKGRYRCQYCNAVKLGNPKDKCEATNEQV